jgi:hypothetical protein
VRLQRQYQDYIKGMGWPQQLDIRLDGKLVKRFEVGGKAVGRPAAASYAGDGEPYFAGDDSWEKYMQIQGDAGLAVTIPVSAGPHMVGVSFVRELFEPEGLPQPLQRGRVITNDQVYMGYANVAQLLVGGPYTKDDGSPKTRPAVARFSFVNQSPGLPTPTSAPALTEYFREWRGLPIDALQRRRMCRHSWSSSTRGAEKERRLRPVSSSLWNACWLIRTFCCASFVRP